MRPIACVALLAASAHAGELHIGNGGEPLTLDPHRYNLNLEEKILADLFEGLTAHDADGRIVPGAAKSWNVSEDGLTWTFRLREDARWSDGAPVTADDFVFSFRRLLDPASVPADLRAEDYLPVGRYALQFLWSDAHYTGIYTYRALRAACTCIACGEARASRE